MKNFKLMNPGNLLVPKHQCGKIFRKIVSLQVSTSYTVKPSDKEHQMWGNHLQKIVFRILFSLR